jgi:hypothetical protein
MDDADLAAAAQQPAAADAAAAAAILRDFTFCGRYLDDLITVDNPSFQHLRYTTDVYHGHHGIFILTTRLYDKSRGAAYEDVGTIRLPHITTFLSSACKYGVITFQFHRFRRNNTTYIDFCREMGILLCAAEDRGYSISCCCTQLHRVARGWPDLYTQQTSHRHNADAIVDDVRNQYPIYRAAHPRR